MFSLWFSEGRLGWGFRLGMGFRECAVCYLEIYVVVGYVFFRGFRFFCSKELSGVLFLLLRNFYRFWLLFFLGIRCIVGWLLFIYLVG